MNDPGKKDENIRTIYQELSTSYRSIDDFRTKLLGFLPLATGGIFAFLIDPKHISDGKLGDITKDLLSLVGGLGALVTLGLYAFEIYGIRKCTALIKVGEHLERELGTQHGQFTDRPEGVLRYISEPLASGIIYPTVLASWIWLAWYGSGSANALSWAVGVFIAFFLLSLLFIVWLRQSEIRARRRAQAIRLGCRK
jgi:hypothetical protein